MTHFAPWVHIETKKKKKKLIFSGVVYASS